MSVGKETTEGVSSSLHRTSLYMYMYKVSGYRRAFLQGDMSRFIQSVAQFKGCLTGALGERRVIDEMRIG